MNDEKLNGEFTDSYTDRMFEQTGIVYCATCDRMIEEDPALTEKQYQDKLENEGFSGDLDGLYKEYLKSNFPKTLEHYGHRLCRTAEEIREQGIIMRMKGK